MNMSKDRFLAIGLMSGTSMDGVDCALIKSNGAMTQSVGQPVHIPYDSVLRTDISAAMKQAASLDDAAHATDQFTDIADRITNVHGQAVAALLQQNDHAPDQIDVIGFHGQTLLHRPEERWTLQIGNGQLLADLTCIPVVNDFRTRDMQNGGEGAPLVPIYHHALITQIGDVSYPVALVNIGGVGNVTWIGSKDAASMLAFDTGPGNALLDDWIEKHTGEPLDRGGMISATGGIELEVLEGWLKDSYFYKSPPKSLDRTSFHVSGLEDLTLENGAATLVEFTVQSIHLALGQCPALPKHIYICGGGRHNATLMRRLRTFGPAVDPVEELGWDGDNLEAEAFAYLACRHLKGLPLTFPGTTGVFQPSPGGTLYQPKGVGSD
ncbi:anhydro-N-acetylmuramic acid kinase [Paremcibacter congregatus]|uniref:anhydro-N-acetylmuramic acid kinase n=1 Tax=Paremcibacter congregatus TaxID=2043170 RepID=UPI0030EEFD12